jgi:hypothetical protein
MIGSNYMIHIEKYRRDSGASLAFNRLVVCEG